MEEVLNTLISIDNDCKRTLNELKEKQDNIEYLVNDEMTKRKDEINTKYKFKIDMRKSEFQIKLNENKQRIENEKMEQIGGIRSKYIEEKNDLIQKIVNEILK